MSQKCIANSDTASALLNKISKLRHRKSRISFVHIVIIDVFIFSAICVLPYFGLGQVVEVSLLIVAAASIMLFAMISFYLDINTHIEKLLAEFYSAIEKQPEVLFLPSYLDRLRNGSDKEVAIAKKCLLELLPTLTEEEALSFPHSHRNTFYRLLTYSDVDLVLAVLQSLPLLGDREALHFVRSLCQGQWSAAKSLKVRKAAQRCLTELPDHFTRRDKQQHLLRPSMSSVSPNVLLRPADGTKLILPEEAAQLLHPASDSAMAS